MRYFTHSSSIIVFAASINAASRKYFAAVFAMPSLFFEDEFFVHGKVENGAYHSCTYVRKRYVPAYHCENAVANIVHAEAKK